MLLGKGAWVRSHERTLQDKVLPLGPSLSTSLDYLAVLSRPEQRHILLFCRPSAARGTGSGMAAWRTLPLVHSCRYT